MAHAKIRHFSKFSYFLTLFSPQSWWSNVLQVATTRVIGVADCAH